MLSLIPKKANGKFEHGSVKEFATKLGFKDGHIVSDWISGNATSYKKYVYQVSDIYNVSQKWLLGETETKEKPSEIEGFSNSDIAIAKKIQSLTKEQRLKLEGYLDSLLGK